MNTKPYLILAALLLTGRHFSSPFSELSPSHEAYTLINEAAADLLKGKYRAGIFSPNQTVNRYDAAKIVRDFCRMVLKNPSGISEDARVRLAILAGEFQGEMEIQGFSAREQEDVLKMGLGEKVLATAPDSTATVPVAAFDTKEPVHFSGELRTRPEFRHVNRPVDGPESFDQQSYRMRLRIDRHLKRGDFFATLQQHGYFGEQDLDPKARPTATQPDADLEFVEFGVKVDLDLERTRSLTVGRQFFKFVSALVSDSQFSERGRTFDGLLYEARNGNSTTKAFVTNLARETYGITSSLNPGADPEGLFYGFDYAFDTSMGGLRLFAYDRTQKEDGGVIGLREELLSYGISGKHELTSRLHLGWTQILQDGDTHLLGARTQTKSGEFQELEFDYHLGDKSLAELRFTRWSGDPNGGANRKNEAFTKLYGSTHSFLGKTDFIDTTNAQEYVLGYKKELRPGLRMALSHHWIRLDEPAQAPALRSELPAYIRSSLTHNRANKEKDLGREIDLIFSWKWSDTMSFILVHGWFESGDYFPANGIQPFDGTYTYLTTTFHF